jgi:hypothetical protein
MGAKLMTVPVKSSRNRRLASRELATRSFKPIQAKNPIAPATVSADSIGPNCV